MSIQAEDKGWLQELKSVWAYATSITIVLFMTTCLVAWFVTWQNGGSNVLSYILAVVDPARAALFMMIVCLVRPAVYSGRPFAFPHVLTLPTLYMAIIYGFKLLGKDAAIEQAREDIERFDLIWLDTQMVLFVWLGLMVILSIVGALRSKPVKGGA